MIKKILLIIIFSLIIIGCSSESEISETELQSSENQEIKKGEQLLFEIEIDNCQMNLLEIKANIGDTINLLISTTSDDEEIYSFWISGYGEDTTVSRSFEGEIIFDVDMSGVYYYSISSLNCDNSEDGNLWIYE